MLLFLTGIIGSIGQSNYGAGNIYQDALAKHRVQTGRKAVALDLGWMGDVGIMAENEELARGYEIEAKISEPEFHALLKLYCSPSLNNSSPWRVQSMIGLVAPAHFHSKGLEPPGWMQAPIFSPLAQMRLKEDSPPAASADVTAADVTDYAAEFARAPSQAEVVIADLVHKLAKALSMAHTEIDITRPLHKYGIDSLMAVELRNWFAKLFRTDVAVFEIICQGNSIGAIGAMVAAKRASKTGDLEEKSKG